MFSIPLLYGIYDWLNYVIRMHKSGLKYCYKLLAMRLTVTSLTWAVGGGCYLNSALAGTRFRQVVII